MVRRGNPIPTQVRLAVDTRDMRRCVRCGAASRELHHRQRRRDGGHGVENIISLCSRDHRWVHAHPAQAREHGLIVSAFETDIASVPALTYYGWATFHDDGSIKWAQQPSTATS